MKHPRKIKVTPRKRRAIRVRSKVSGTPERPRMAVSRSLKNIYVQLIDDSKGMTLVGVSSLAPAIRSMKIEGGKKGAAKAVGKVIAEKAREKGITSVVFDRSGNLFHGRVKAVAEGAREGGLQF